MAHYPGHKGGFSSGRSGAAQRSFKRSVSKARSKEGIDTRSLSQKNAALEEAQRRANQQAKGSDDGRSSALLKQFSKSLQPTIDRNKFLMDQEQRRADILSGKITPKKSDFTGFEGGILGLRIGDFTDTNQPKIREGLTSAQYADYMRDLYDANPAMMEKMFPVASGKALRNVSRLMPGLGTLQTIAGFLGDKTGDAVQGLKQIAINKGILPNDKLDPTTGTTAVSGPAYDPSGLEGYRDAIMRMNQSRSPLERFTPRQQLDAIQSFSVPGTGLFPVFDSYSVIPTTPEGAAQFNEIVEQSKTPPNINVAEFIAPDVYGGRSPMDEAFASLPTTQFGREYMERFGPRQDFTTFNEGGLASINNPEYTMLRRASDFDI